MVCCVMRSKIQKMKGGIFRLLQLKAVVVGVAVSNPTLAYLEAKSVEGMMFCFGAPWYISGTFAYFPYLLLVAALGLYLGRWWGYLAAVAFSAPVLYQGLLSFFLAESFHSWHLGMRYQPGLGFQFAFAVAISCWSLTTMIRIMSQRRAPIG